MLRNKLFPLKKLNKNILRNYSNNLEYSGISLVNKNHLKHASFDYDKISYLNKRNLSKLSGHKITRIRKMSELPNNDKNEK